MKADKKLFAVVHNIRSLHNVGSVLRTADAAGVSKVYLTGYTPSPCDEMGRIRKEISKTALGAERSVQWEVVKNISKLILELKKDSVQVIALEQARGAVDYRTIRANGSIALIIGNEVRGLSSAILKKADALIKIPMRGRKESLNVSVAFGIAAYTLKDY